MSQSDFSSCSPSSQRGSGMVVQSKLQTACQHSLGPNVLSTFTAKAVGKLLFCTKRRVMKLAGRINQLETVPEFIV